MKTEKEYEFTYWKDNGKYQKEYQKFYDELVPHQGKSKTTDGELLRCISRFYHDRHNNGHCNDKSYEITFVNSFKWDTGLDIHISYEMDDKELDKTIDKIIEYLMRD